MGGGGPCGGWSELESHMLAVPAACLGLLPIDPTEAAAAAAATAALGGMPTGGGGPAIKFCPPLAPAPTTRRSLPIGLALGT